MERTWRWFGKNDKITLDMLRQIGVEGIVTALHDVPNGVDKRENQRPQGIYRKLRHEVVGGGKPACVGKHKVCGR